jgi:hypothetical protein
MLYLPLFLSSTISALLFDSCINANQYTLLPFNLCPRTRTPIAPQPDLTSTTRSCHASKRGHPYTLLQPLRSSGHLISHLHCQIGAAPNLSLLILQTPTPVPVPFDTPTVFVLCLIRVFTQILLLPFSDLAQHPLCTLLLVSLQHLPNAILSRPDINFRFHDLTKALFTHLSSGIFVRPACVFGRHINLGVGFVPSREVLICLGLDGTEITGNKGDNSGDAGFGIYCENQFVFLSYRLRCFLPREIKSCLIPKYASPTPIRLMLALVTSR